MDDKTQANAPFKGSYDHLNGELAQDVKITLDMDSLADMIVARNYGAVRFLAAFIRARERSCRFPDGNDELAEGIKELLEQGLT